MKRVLRTTMMALLVMMLLVSMMAPAALAAYEPVSKTLTVTVDMFASPAEGTVPESDVIPVTVKALDGTPSLSVSSYNVNCVGNGSNGTGSVDITFGDYNKPGIYTYGVTIGKSSCTDLVMNDELTHYVVILSVVNKDDYSGLEIKVGIREAEVVDGEYRYDESGLNKPDAMIASKTYAAPLTITLSKHWPDGGKRPVTFYLYEVIDNTTEDLNDDGKIDDADTRKKVNEVVLNAENSWQYNFKTTSDGKLLDSRKDYVLDELDVPGYHESYRYNKDDALNWIVNVTNSKSLYQTGQLNWPIPVLVCVGSLFMIAGVMMLRKKEEQVNG